MVGLTILALTVAVLGRILSPSIVLDAVALWPLAALALPAIIIGFSGGRRRALAPLVLLSWILIAVGLHLGRLEGLPSSAATITADLGSAADGRLVAALPDVALVVGPGPFAVAPLPSGGTGGVPVIERVAGDTSVSLTLTDDPDRSVWFRFGTFEVTLPSSPSWNLQLEGKRIEADLRSVTVTAVTLRAPTGSVQLGPPPGGVVVEVEGDFDMSVPSDVPVTVMGPATVPGGWTVNGDTAHSPTDGAGWRIVVGSGSVRIATR